MQLTEAASKEAVIVENLWFKYSREYVLKGISFTFNKRILVIVGPNGSGKTTLLKCMGGLLKPTRGKIIILGKDLWSVDEKERLELRRQIIYVHEKPFLFRGTVYRNIEYPLKIRGISAGERERRVLSVAESLGIKHLLERKSRELSAGETRLVALARAIVVEPKYLLLDEPLANLDSKKESLVLNLLKEISSKTKIIIASHRKRIFSIAEKAFILENGELRELEVSSIEGNIL